MRKITDWFWVEDVYNPVLVKQGWSNYQVVDHGGYFSVSLAKSKDGIKEVQSIAAGVESYESAIEIIKDYDCDNYEPTSIYAIIAIITMIPLSVWLITKLT